MSKTLGQISYEVDRLVVGFSSPVALEWGELEQYERTLFELRATAVAKAERERGKDEIDLAHAAYKMLSAAASESEWIPHDHYMSNDWLADCCEFLRTGQALTKEVTK